MLKEVQPVAIYHRVMRRENFETAAKDLVRLLADTQKMKPNLPRELYLDIFLFCIRKIRMLFSCHLFFLLLDHFECCTRLAKGRQNGWLSEIIGKNHVTFRDACKYLGEPEIYNDFQTASAFVHGQDIVSKCIPFTFYATIYHKLYIMMYYIFRTVRLYLSAEEFEDELEMLEKELMELSQNYL